ncbi:N-acetyl sugar amidotransferase [Parasphingorhabdus halotolerans]|uniref:N-acetyl sugar amidotransferase n=2 Tax=Parasphingorhabdus halotolerans TaxID=2725558 RepID=A0A6H2DPR8_9SPHN|nr:N-acetyl sugar amidotransferase [Parasphingorhabdus halotolerans]
MADREYQICTRCIMDTSDPNIIFDGAGRCDYCVNFDEVMQPAWNADKANSVKLDKVTDEIRTAGKGKDFDCIIGLSGGLDSSYVAHIVTKVMKLRPLLVHVDAGWNTDQAVGNIEKLVDGLGADLYTDVVDWGEMKDLQLAFFKAQIPDQDLPQDASFFSGLYKFARKYGVKHIVTGANHQTECCREPEEWGGYPGIDKLLFQDIMKKFGRKKLNNLQLIDIMRYKLYYRYILGMKVYKPLDLIKYTKAEAETTLAKEYGWKPFQHKHHESRFTRFYEDYWLPKKFGYEKRRAHFSSLIMTGEMTRDAALKRISAPELDGHFLKEEFDYVASKLGITSKELQDIFDGPNKTYREYKNKRWMIKLGADAMQAMGLEKRLFR